ncbi:MULTISPECIES: FTR1 family protein [unclassified Sulfurospirillum]|uniref:FTR1 family iron permease n=1 Tax=unclassified Sulfurospirillum TaxID=2618290 RepID=UPI0004FF6584|nr:MULTISPECIES: FTR1 family protein [unclassified Sulfurospirillum]KFL33465.1 iron permease [Sulfurospirillum sp. SCADC]
MLCLFLMGFLPSLLFSAATTNYADIMNRINQTFQESLALYEKGEQEEAKQVAQSAYFELFENLEGPIRINVSGKKSYAMEAQFVSIRKLINDGASITEVKAVMDNLSAEMAEVLPKLEKGTRLVGEKSDDSHVEVATQTPEPTLDIKWKTLYNHIETKYAKALVAFEKGDKEETKFIITSVKFEEYRNGMIETAVRKYISKWRDSQIQQEMGRVIRAVDEEIHTKEELERLKSNIWHSLLELPTDAAKLAVVSVKEEAIEEVKEDFAPVMANLKAKLAEAHTLYRTGEAKKAMQLVQNFYFDIFEASGMEVKIGAGDSTLKTSIEGSFSKIVALMKNQSSPESVLSEMDSLNTQVASGAEKLSGSDSPWSQFLYALIIILREGIEALIVVTAVIAYLIKSGNTTRLNIVYSALWSAIILSFVTAFVMNLIFQNPGESREMLEGVTMLVAVGLLYYVGFWLLSNAHAKKWSHYIAEKVSESLSSGSIRALWFTVFLAVYREGAETVLFYQALIFDAKTPLGYSMLAAGFGIGVIALVILFFLLKAGAIRIPIKPFFMITSAIIFYMAIVFTGKGIMELVEGKVFQPTLIEGFPTMTWLGLYPYMQSLIPQAVLVLGLVFGSLYIMIQAKKA